MLTAMILTATAEPPLPWSKARAAAKGLVAKMTPAERASLLLGKNWTLGTLEKWFYVGNIPPVSRLGLPSLNMQDNAGGFRTYWPELVGSVTCWPSLLAMASTWDPALVGKFADALGEEFAAKGANAILGPSINVHRVARGGRNFEYLSGEDPYLGARLVGPYIVGVQRHGVMAVMKHFAFNHQETGRQSGSDSRVGAKVAWELYYPPYEAAIAAGVSGVMCAYNRVNGTQACSSRSLLQRDLRSRMGFEGFVQSDWGATHSTEDLASGLDMEMPLSFDSLVQRTYYFGQGALATQDPKHVAAAAERVVTAALRLGLSRRRSSEGTVCNPPPCEHVLRTSVTSAAHATLARQAAAASIVLLRNEPRPSAGALPVLPLSNATVSSIAIIGSAAVAPVSEPFDGQAWNVGDLYSGGGSGHVVAGRSQLITAYDGIARRARRERIEVLNTSTDDIGRATAAAAKVDVSIIVVGTTSGEAEDRSSLRLDHDADQLVTAVSRVAKRTVVLVMAPGAFLTPWRGRVDAVLAMFLGGQGSGGAWADVLFGDTPPMGRLPINLPASEDDTIPPTPCCYPGQSGAVHYSEGLYTSYRNPAVFPAYPFGFGLSYTRFEYGEPKYCNRSTSGSEGSGDSGKRSARSDEAACLTIEITNVGSAVGAEIAQLYLTFPPVAQQPPVALLKGFQKTKILAPNESEVLTFMLSARDVSYYDVDTGAWNVASPLQAHFRTSSSARATRQSIGITPATL